MLFPNSVREINRFLRAARISLILIDLCDFVFRPHLSPTVSTNTNDDDFFHDILNSLTYLCNWLNSDILNNEIAESADNNIDDNNNNNTDDDNDNDNDNRDILCSTEKLPDATSYYQITYLAD
ncbi:unnamed protein product [Onchocerca ochengi]|uniref:Ras-GEF domain-containing protein n=1 Tax=Onchocerca ochengi TaxID=42157 RepID=A0A182ESN0_ONCOC|nr:unnamed protein product [Onchocerca ochengi]